MNIRRAGAGDVEAVMELIRRQTRRPNEQRAEHGAAQNGIDIGVARYFRENINSFLLAEQDGRLTGALAVFDQDSAWKDHAAACYLQHLVSDAEHPESKAALLHFAEKMASLRGCSLSRIVLPLKDHVRADLLESMGYRATGIFPLGRSWLVKREKDLRREAPPYDAGGFFDSEGLQDGEIRLVLEKTSPADPERGRVPAYHFAICGEGGERMGWCSLRIGHCEALYYAGHIGYGVDEPYRGRHLAVRACRLLFRLADKHGLGYVLITCDPDNPASRRTAELAGCEYLETAPLPEWHDLAKEGFREVCVYGKKL
ncbi:MAG: GNAT family N-acetyltransferase [Lachnospiraceae bacterium]|nr:GNAT family N-acetyltransferase [Lachnospiraceae bacterium]